jgi:hypothetical protein
VTRPTSAALALAAAALVASAACGKKGNPLPPLRPVPARVTDLTARRTADGIQLHLTIPSGNTDGTTPPAVERVEIYAKPVAADATIASTADAITGDSANRRTTIAVRRPEPESETTEETPADAGAPPPAAPAAPLAPLAGDAVTFEDHQAPAWTGAPAVDYVAVAIAGGGRGRRSPLSAIVSVPLGDLPKAPADIRIESDDTVTRLSWTMPRLPGPPPPAALAVLPAPASQAAVAPAVSAADAASMFVLPAPVIALPAAPTAPVAAFGGGRSGGQGARGFPAGPAGRGGRSGRGAATTAVARPPAPPARVVAEVLRVNSSPKPGEPALALLTPTPVSQPTFSLPVEFGVEQCFVVRALVVTGPVTLEGAPSAPTCITPVDRYPPPAPTGLQVIQEGTAVTVNWSPVEAADLAGYIVLRGDGTGETMRPLTRDPVTTTIYRDQTAAAGATYTYSVYAVDRATPPNVSQQSNRETITVR